MTPYKYSCYYPKCTHLTINWVHVTWPQSIISLWLVSNYIGWWQEGHKSSAKITSYAVYFPSTPFLSPLSIPSPSWKGHGGMVLKTLYGGRITGKRLTKIRLEEWPPNWCMCVCVTEACVSATCLESICERGMTGSRTSDLLTASPTP